MSRLCAIGSRISSIELRPGHIRISEPFRDEQEGLYKLGPRLTQPTPVSTPTKLRLIIMVSILSQSSLRSLQENAVPQMELPLGPNEVSCWILASF